MNRSNRESDSQKPDADGNGSVLGSEGGEHELDRADLEDWIGELRDPDVSQRPQV